MELQISKMLKSFVTVNPSLVSLISTVELPAWVVFCIPLCCMQLSQVCGCVQFPLADYQTAQEIEERKGRTPKDYCNFLKHNADARRAQSGGKGVAARRRANGTISYEARISKHNFGVSVPHAVRIPELASAASWCCRSLIAPAFLNTSHKPKVAVSLLLPLSPCS